MVRYLYNPLAWKLGAPIPLMKTSTRQPNIKYFYKTQEPKLIWKNGLEERTFTFPLSSPETYNPLSTFL